VQARLLPAILSVSSLSMALVQVQSGPSFAVPWQGYYFYPSCHQVAVSTCRRKAKYRIVAPLRAPRLAFPHLSLTDDNADDADDGKFDLNIAKILGASFRNMPSLDLDLAFGAVDSNVDLAYTRLLSLPSPLLPPLPSAPSSVPAGEPF